MILVALLIGIVLIVAAIRNSQDSLFTAIGTDVPAFVVWAAAILALGAIGYLPGLKPVSRGLMALVLTVIVLRNYKGIISGFQNAAAPTTPPDSNGASGPVASVIGDSPLPSGSSLIQDYIKKYGVAPSQQAIDLFNHQNANDVPLSQWNR